MRLCMFLVVGVVVLGGPAAAADRPARKPLDANERTALVSLIKAVDATQDVDGSGEAGLRWDAHVIKSTNVAYVPFRLMLPAAAHATKAAAMYVRAVSRRDGRPSTEETSTLREWLRHPEESQPRSAETVTLAPGELPIGGPALAASRRSVAAPAEASTVLTMQQRVFEQEKAAADAERQRAQARTRDPHTFPFEDYYFFDVASDDVERAIALPPGEYDVFVAVVDRAGGKIGTPAVVRHTVTVPDFWNLELRLSDLILVDDVRALKAPLPAKEQIAHPYTWGRAQVMPAASRTLSQHGTLGVVYQVCNYGAPDPELVAEYDFYWQTGGEWRLFNRTRPQALTSDDLPPPIGWDTQGFVMHRVPLESFTPGDYKLQVVVRDRLTLQTATQSVLFTVK